MTRRTRHPRSASASLVIAALSLASGCAAGPVEVPFESAELHAVDTGQAWLEVARYLDPKSKHAPYRLEGKQRYFNGGELPTILYFPDHDQLVLHWQYSFPGAIGCPDTELAIAAAFETPDRTSYRILNGNEAGRGWVVQADVGEFWAGPFARPEVLSSIEPGRAELDEDGFSFPSALGLTMAGMDRVEFQISHLASRSEALHVVSALEAVFASCGFGEATKPTATTVEASIPRPEEGSPAPRDAVQPTTLPGGFRRPGR